MPLSTWTTSSIRPIYAVNAIVNLSINTVRAWYTRVNIWISSFRQKDFELFASSNFQFQIDDSSSKEMSMAFLRPYSLKLSLFLFDLQFFSSSSLSKSMKILSLSLSIFSHSGPKDMPIEHRFISIPIYRMSIINSLNICQKWLWIDAICKW